METLSNMVTTVDAPQVDPVTLPDLPSAPLPTLPYTATVEQAVNAAVRAINAVHKAREFDCAPQYAEAVSQIGKALLTALHIENLDGPSAVKTVRARLISAAKERTETPRPLTLYDTRVGEDGKRETYALPAEKQPKPRPGTYFQAYQRVMDLARWLPELGLWRKGEAPIPQVLIAEGGTADEPGPENMVRVQGTYYYSPVDALLDGRTLESVHQGWANRVRPAKVDLSDFRAQAPSAVRASFGRFFVTVRDKTAPAGRRRVKVVQRPEMLAAVIEAAVAEADKQGPKWQDAIKATIVAIGARWATPALPEAKPETT